MSKPNFYWVTRTARRNRLTAARLRALGHSALTIPVLQIRAMEAAAPERPPDAIAFTSSHGVDHHPIDFDLLHLPVFTVGDHTARVARASGYRHVRSAEGNVLDLQKLISRELAKPAFIIHYGAKEPAGNLAAVLQQCGFRAEHRAVYTSRPATAKELEGPIAALNTIDGILVYSPKGAARIAELILEHGWYGELLCISEACAEPFAHLPGLLVSVAPEPNEPALLNLIRRAHSHDHAGHVGGSFESVRGLQLASDNVIPIFGRRSPPVLTPGRDPDNPPPTAA